MGKNIEQRMRELESAIQASEKEPNRLKRVSCNIRICQVAVEEMMAEMRADVDFQANEDIQIRFHRYELPHMLGKWLFFKRCYALECISLTSRGEKRKEHLQEQLQEAKDFFFAYRGFIQYYFSNDQKLDKDLFTINSTVEHRLMPKGEELPLDLNPGSLLAAYLLAYLEFARALVDTIGDQEPSVTNAERKSRFTYNGPFIDMIALGLLLYLSKNFLVDGKPSTEKQMYEWLEEATGVPTGSFAQRISELKSKAEPLSKIKEWLKIADAHLSKLPEDRSRRKLR